MRNTVGWNVNECSIGEARKQVNSKHDWSVIAAIIVDAWDDAWEDDAYKSSVIGDEVKGNQIRIEVSGGKEETTWAVDVPEWMLSQFMAALIMFDSGEINQILVGSSSDDHVTGERSGISIYEKLKKQRIAQDKNRGGTVNKTWIDDPMTQERIKNIPEPEIKDNEYN